MHLTAAPSALDLTAQVGKGAKAFSLKGKHSRQQLVATATDTGKQVDVSRKVKYAATPAKVVAIDATGMVTPLGNGEATITATHAGGLKATVKVSVKEFDVVQPINFGNEIVPIFTKAGCNSGGCHGKSGGQNGFRLSLLGFEPQEDYEYLVKESRGRRLSPAAPANSLVLLKGGAILPHGGGARLDPNSYDWDLMVRWIKQGMPRGSEDDPIIAGLEVYPKQRLVTANGSQQLSVTAIYSDGHTEDASHIATYEANDKEIAEVDKTGHVTFFEQPGDVSVMIRYLGQVSVYQASVPLGAPVAQVPQPRNFIDNLVFDKLKLVGMPPSAVSDDATFLRRVSIDIAGRLPTDAESEAFLNSTDPAKRDKLIDRLLASTDYADYFANKWGALLRNKRANTASMRGNYAFHGWIRDSLHKNMRYDEFTRNVLAASGDMAKNPGAFWYREVKTMQTQMEDSAQLFLGTRMQCAQCHHHPFEKWSQKDYYSFSAFFSTVGRKPGQNPGEEVIYHTRKVAQTANKKDGGTVKATGLGDAPLDLTADDDPRHALVDWMSGSNNKFFAHTLVNRYWKHFFSRGLVEPEDDMRETNPAVNPELLEALAQDFIKNKFDMKQLIRTICQSKTYQLSSIPNEFNAKDKTYFSRYYPKRLNAEVLYDAINQMTGSQPSFSGLPVGTRAVQLPDNSFNSQSYFLTVFGRPDSSSSCECERSSDASLAQSLHLLNSKDIQGKLASGSGRAAKLSSAKTPADEALAKAKTEHAAADKALVAVNAEVDKAKAAAKTDDLKKKLAELIDKKQKPAQAKADTTKEALAKAQAEAAGAEDERIRSLFLLAFSREPSGSEVVLARAHLERIIKDKDGNEKSADRKGSYEDIIWALFNTKEFLFNH
uniref:S-layer protein n=1 Tax=uncultured marine thaumarchaeote KM3_23_F10 TaxID=1456100 RepID=A0A075GXU0_9ARCH|nr:hypothetical protein, containing DUF1549 domain [uncultured marine thaumarchaeote KM3_23_F10]